MNTITKRRSPSPPTPTESNKQNLAELQLIASEIGATRTEVIRGAIRVMVYYVDPDKDDPEYNIFYDEVDIELGDQPHKILIAVFPEDAPCPQS